MRLNCRCCSLIHCSSRANHWSAPRMTVWCRIDSSAGKAAGLREAAKCQFSKPAERRWAHPWAGRADQAARVLAPVARITIVGVVPIVVVMIAIAHVAVIRAFHITQWLVQAERQQGFGGHAH